ncbi:DUF6555 family protein [Pseudomonas sp. RIT-PI-S]|uniref:DUF6555 family protein n=1 Tax=Pseudomonas sp. RIT-PI-S TaxID=3035295 RepID=UPI0021D94E85|nr:DUF6555 family protein [Pseudomonas sp. RIT-PI-S]
MALHKHYVIRYHYKGQVRSFAQRDSRMSSADAWYYASLHAGTVQLYGVAAIRNSARAVRLFAEQCGVTDVGFREVP